MQFRTTEAKLLLLIDETLNMGCAVLRKPLPVIRPLALTIGTIYGGDEWEINLER